MFTRRVARQIRADSRTLALADVTALSVLLESSLTVQQAHVHGATLALASLTAVDTHTAMLTFEHTLHWRTHWFLWVAFTCLATTVIQLKAMLTMHHAFYIRAHRIAFTYWASVDILLEASFTEH